MIGGNIRKVALAKDDFRSGGKDKLPFDQDREAPS